ncbi:hypothetical protein QOT17_000177 [Balamuthia mandrillaris]
MEGRGVVTIDRHGIIRSVNRYTVVMFGYTSQSELIGQDLKILIPSPYKEQHDQYLKNYHCTRQAKVIGRSRVVEGLRKNGDIFSLRLAVSEISIGEDVLYCGLIEVLDDKSAVAFCDAHGIITATNGECDKLFGYNRNELIGQNVSVLAEDFHAERHAKYMQNYLDTGVKKALDKVRNVNGKHKDGTVFPISLEVSERNEGDQKTFLAKINQITEEMEALVTIDSKGTIVDLNRNLWVLWGYKKEELLGKNVKVLMSHPHAELHDNYIKRYLRTGQKRIIGGPPRVVKAKHKDGSNFYVFLEINEFQQGGETFFGGKVTRVVNPKKKPASTAAVPTGCPFAAAKTPEASNNKDEEQQPVGATGDMEDTDSKYIGNYVVDRTLANGLFGKVKLATHLLTGQKVVIKVIEKQKIDPERFREIDLMKRLRHANVVRMLEVIEAPQKLYIVYEYIDGGELFEYMTEKDHLSEDEARTFWRQLVEAVKYMHDNGIAHRDIKLENIMLNQDGNVVVIDLGLGNFTSSGRLLSTFCGSSAYAAPEMFLCRKYVGEKVDVWSMGVVLYCLITSVLPFEDPKYIIKADYIPLDEACEGRPTSPEFGDLIDRIFQSDPEKRISLEEICNHPWTNKGHKPLLQELEEKHVDYVDVEATPSPQVIEALTEFGFNQQDILNSIAQKAFNSITASLFLVQKDLKQKAQQQKRKPMQSFHQPSHNNKTAIVN